LLEPEAEDVELGQQDDLAADVDDGAAGEDPEALDSEDDGLADLDIDEASEGKSPSSQMLVVAEESSAYARPPPLLTSSDRAADAGLPLPTAQSPSRHSSNKCRRDIPHNSRDPVRR